MRVYIETTIPSYLTAKPSRDLIVAAHQAITHEWWESKPEFTDLYTSELVARECEKGDPMAADARAKLLQGIPTLAITEECIFVAQALVKGEMVPPTAAQDAIHISTATVHDMDVLLTWNCRHIANGAVSKQLHSFLRGLGYEAPALCTPEELMGGDDQ